jgi:hypothetical protein
MTRGIAMAMWSPPNERHQVQQQDDDDEHQDDDLDDVGGH